MIRIPLLKKIASYFYPVRIIKSSGASDTAPELFFYRNRWQLATQDALYSDGAHYRPLVFAFNKLGKRILSVKRILVLGAGLGSAQSVLEKMSVDAHYTWVDIDNQTLIWAKEILTVLHGKKESRFICDDAGHFMDTNQERFDMIVIDVFCGRTVPSFVQDTPFLRQCKKALNTQGMLIMNYIVNDKDEWKHLQQNFAGVFPGYQSYSMDINRVLIV